MPPPLPPVPYIALRPWHIMEGHGKVIEVHTEREAQALRDDGYIVIKHPAVGQPDEDGA